MPNQNILIKNNQIKSCGTFQYRDVKNNALEKAISRVSSSQSFPQHASISAHSSVSTSAKVAIGILLLTSVVASASASEASQSLSCIEVVKKDRSGSLIKNNCDFRVGLKFKGKCGTDKAEKKIEAKDTLHLNKLETHCLKKTHRVEIKSDDGIFYGKINFPTNLKSEEKGNDALIEKIEKINKYENKNLRLVKLIKLLSGNISDSTKKLIGDYLIAMEMGSGMSMLDLFNAVGKNRQNDNELSNASLSLMRLLIEHKRDINKEYVENLKSAYNPNCGQAKSKFGETFWAENSCKAPIGFFMRNEPVSKFIDADGKEYNHRYKTIYGNSFVYLNYHTMNGYFDRLPIHQGALPFPDISIHSIM